MLDVVRTVNVGIAVLLLVGCNTPPGQVGNSGSSETLANPSGSTTDEPDPTEASATATSQNGSGTTSGTTDAPATTLPLDDSGTTTLDPSTTSGSSGDPTTTGMESSTGEPGDCHPLLAEVLYDPPGGNNNNQWIELYNPCSEEIVLTDTYSLGWGGNDYAGQGQDLVGSIAAGGCFVIGGPNSDASNGMPVYDQLENLNGDLQTANDGVADGVALFDVVESSVNASTIPIDAVIYGDVNTNELLDADGATPPPHLPSAREGQSIRRVDEATPTWVAESMPAPNDCLPR